MKLLFHLVSGQNLPNYIAAKIIKPDKNIFLCSKEAIRQFDVFKRVLNNSEKKEIESWNYEKIINDLSVIIKDYSDNEIILNFTGGNKIMSLATFNFFREIKQNCIYVNTEKNQIICFDNINNKISYRPIEAKLSIQDILSLNNQNFEISSEKLTNEYKTLKEIISSDDLLQKELLTIAKKLSQNKNTPFKEIISKKHLNSSEIIYQNNITSLRILNNNKEIFNQIEKGRKLLDFIFGEWFEYECYELLKNLNYFDELKRDITIIRKNSSETDKYQEKNQIDIFGIKGIYNYIFECKSGNIKSEAIDKLIAIKESYIGRYSSLFFISKYPLNWQDTNHKIVLEKIKENKIYHLTLKELKDSPRVISLFNNRENLR